MLIAYFKAGLIFYSALLFSLIFIEFISTPNVLVGSLRSTVNFRPTYHGFFRAPSHLPAIPP